MIPSRKFGRRSSNFLGIHWNQGGQSCLCAKGNPRYRASACREMFRSRKKYEHEACKPASVIFDRTNLTRFMSYVVHWLHRTKFGKVKERICMLNHLLLRKRLASCSSCKRSNNSHLAKCSASKRMDDYSVEADRGRIDGSID